MNTGSSKSLDSGAWRDLYKAALFEVDNARLPERIAQAEKALERDGTLVWLKVYPRLNGLRGEPRFRDLLARMRLDS